MSDTKPKVVDLREDLKRGDTVFVLADDQAIGPSNVTGVGAPGAGPATDKRKDYEKWPRKVKTWHGSVPFHDGREQTRFPIDEKCGVAGKDGKPCVQRLIAMKVVNQKFEKDSYGFGGQLNADFSDYRYYTQCVIHGPYPAGPQKWGADGKALD